MKVILNSKELSELVAEYGKEMFPSLRRLGGNVTCQLMGKKKLLGKPDEIYMEIEEVQDEQD